MPLDAHVTSLTLKHANLNKEISEETRRPSPDTIRLTKLKREKLRLKEEIERFLHS